MSCIIKHENETCEKFWLLETIFIFLFESIKYLYQKIRFILKLLQFLFVK